MQTLWLFGPVRVKVVQDRGFLHNYVYWFFCRTYLRVLTSLGRIEPLTL
jgi:hypothetical protein